jgi:hypothetical protein
LLVRVAGVKNNRLRLTEEPVIENCRGIDRDRLEDDATTSPLAPPDEGIRIRFGKDDEIKIELELLRPAG